MIQCQEYHPEKDKTGKRKIPIQQCENEATISYLFHGKKVAVCKRCYTAYIEWKRG